MDCDKRLGQILVELKQISPEQLTQALEFKKSCPTRKLGQIFVEMKLLTESDILEALSKQFGFLTLGKPNGKRKEWTIP